MSELEELAGAVTSAIASGNDAHLHASNADELCARISVAGEALGFGNDPALIASAHEKVITALNGLFSALADFEQAHELISQALET